jgi:hypothetical protein
MALRHEHQSSLCIETKPAEFALPCNCTPKIGYAILHKIASKLNIMHAGLAGAAALDGAD